MSIPSVNIDWAETWEYEIVSGFPNRLKPPKQLQDSGLKSSYKAGFINEPPPANMVAYQWWLIGQWQKHFISLYPVDTIKSYSTNIAASVLDDIMGGTWVDIGTSSVGSSPSTAVYFYKRVA